jgi:hypothetical protein
VLQYKKLFLSRRLEFRQFELFRALPSPFLRLVAALAKTTTKTADEAEPSSHDCPDTKSADPLPSGGLHNESF